MDFTTMSRQAEVRVYFRDLEHILADRIQRYDLIVGCVAWLTNERLIRAMSQVPLGVAIVVQKEDFLRPDSDRPGGWKSKLRRMYDTLSTGIERRHFGGIMADLSTCGDPSMHPVRCVGNHNRDRNPAFPRMHHKFLVFCHVVNVETEWGDSFEVRPVEVWTGSFNLTQNATRSTENAVVIRDERIVEAYYNEWMQIEAISEPLDWTSDWCEPEWRIGS